MVLLTIRWKGQPKTLASAVNPVETELDIYVGDQNDEEYLEKNWKGQVRVIPDAANYTGS